MRSKSPRGEKYFIFFNYDFTRMCCLGLLKYKYEVFDKYKVFKALLENDMDLKIKCLKYDRGGEILSNEIFSLCEQHGIKRWFSIAKNPQQNGVEKRMNINVQQMACTMLDVLGTPHTFSGQATHTVVTILKKAHV